MAAPGSSPLPIRHSNAAPGTPTIRRTPIETIEDDNELAGDTIPCSPAAFLSDRDKSSLKPTQLLSSPPNFVQPLRSSSPASIVEVPASSPFRPKPKTSLGSRLAPAGTVFRPPPNQPTPQKKKPQPDPISLISDDEDDLTPPRGDIRPTAFKAHISGFAYKPEPKQKDTEKLRKVFDILGNEFSVPMVEDALRRNHGSINDTVLFLQDGRDSHSSKKAAKMRRRLGASMARQETLERLSSESDSKSSGKRTLSSISQAPKPVRDVVEIGSSSPPRPAKRRLVQGLRKRSFSPSQTPAFEEPPPSSDDPLIIDLVDNDVQDAYQAERSPSPENTDESVLKCLNDSTLKELGAMTGLKEAQLAPMIENRPFASLDRARRVSIKKPSSRGSGKVNVGDNVVDAISVYMNAVSAIDQVVAKCETKAQAVKSVVEEWDMDTFGHRKRSPQGTPDKGGLLTPISMGEIKYKSLLIPQQPRRMDGHCVMKPFQLFGLNWMNVLYNYDIGCILADEMGLGKTCQVISFVCSLVEKYEARPQGDRPWPNLIVVPPSTYNNWLAEFERFAPDLSVVGYRGSQSERADIAWEVEHHPDDYHVVLATYSQINSETDVEAMQSFDLNAAIFDEGHKMKNPETKVYKDLKRITASWKMLLTGTPVQNNLLEMTSLLNFINPKMFDGYMDQIQYIFSHKVTIRDVTNGAFLYGERVRRARTILEPFILQRRKDQVLSDMPKKINTVVHCDLTAEQKPMYDNLEELFRAEPATRAKRPVKGRQNDVNNIWIQLRKAALHPLLFRHHFTDEVTEKMGRILMENVDQSELRQEDLKHLIQELRNSSDFELHLWCRDYPRLLDKFDIPNEMELNSGKVKKLLELVEQYQQNGDRVLVFSKFSRLIELLTEVLATQDIDHRVLMGSTNVAERQDLIDEFNSDPSIPVFLLTTGAGGTGINLTAANKVIIFDQSDNPQDDIQAENRAHRLGQKRDVEIVRLISSGTVEELIYKACSKKIELANKVTGAVEEAQDEAETARNLEQEVRMMMEGSQK